MYWKHRTMKDLWHSAFLSLLFAYKWAHGWPDGAPCVHAVVESMNPLEAVEHQGGLQMSVPPFFIELEQKCYWANQPVALTLRGNSSADKFKGFAIQPIVYRGSKLGKRIGQFLRLDDNGSWQQQCFRQRNSVTHSHDETKKRMQLWWKNDEDDTQFVQFVATVVVSLRKFWVKTVLSDPLPPCSVQQQIGHWQRGAVTPPPPVSNFKMQAFQMFNMDRADIIENSIANVPTDNEGKRRVGVFQPLATPPPIQFQPPVSTTPSAVQRRRLNHIIPIPEMETNKRPRPTQSTQFVARLAPLATTMRPNVPLQNRNNFTFRQTPAPVVFQPVFATQNSCRDFDSASQCFSWLSFCGNSLYMQQFCRRTCRFC